MATEQRTVKEKLEVTDREALLRSILESPQDDTPRLIYSDWLDENGESERAEFVRVQIELARSARPCPQGIANKEVGYRQNPHSCFMCSGSGGMIYDCDNPNELRRRERELFDSCWEQLPLVPIKNSITTLGPVVTPNPHAAVGLFRRGFIASLAISWSDFLTHEAAILREHPVTRVRLTSPSSGDVAWAEGPLFLYAFDRAEVGESFRFDRVKCETCGGFGNVGEIGEELKVCPSCQGRGRPNEWACDRWSRIVFEMPEPVERTHWRRTYVFRTLPMDRLRQIQNGVHRLNSTPFEAMPAGSIELVSINGRQVGEGREWRVDARFEEAPAPLRLLAEDGEVTIPTHGEADFDAVFAGGEELLDERRFVAGMPEADYLRGPSPFQTTLPAFNTLRQFSEATRAAAMTAAGAMRDFATAAAPAIQAVVGAWPRDEDGNLIELGEPAVTDEGV